MLEAILDDDQDMQDMYLARRAEMAQLTAPDPDHPPDDPANPGLANLPSISSSSVAEATLAQALQSVAATQTAPAQAAAQEAAQEAAHNVVQRSNEEAASHQWQRQESGSRGLSQHPLEMAVPDQASFESCLAAVMLICMWAYMINHGAPCLSCQRNKGEEQRARRQGPQTAQNMCRQEDVPRGGVNIHMLASLPYMNASAFMSTEVDVHHLLVKR